jgi:hypothetical protein
MEGVLTRLVDRFDHHNVPLPTKQYWKVGAPVIDCEQLVISAYQVYLGTPGQQLPQPVRGNAPRSALIRAMLARQTPQPDSRGNEPTTAKQQEGAAISAVDMWVMLDAVNYLDAWDAVGAFGLGVTAMVEVEEPSGGLQVVTATFEIAIP